jgi:hypothetical protein
MRATTRNNRIFGHNISQKGCCIFVFEIQLIQSKQSKSINNQKIMNKKGTEPAHDLFHHITSHITSPSRHNYIKE